jgi:hypothetical protein
MESEDTFSEAGTLLKQASGTGDKYARLRGGANLAVWNMLQGFGDEAEKVVTNLEDYESYRGSYQILGELRMMQGQLAEAWQLIQKSLELYKSGNALLLLGDLSLIRGETQQALSYWDDASTSRMYLIHGTCGTHTILRNFLDPLALCGSDGEAGMVLRQVPFVGDFVLIADLVSVTGKTLNGQVGTVTCWNHFSGRIGVRVDGFGDAKALKLQNLKLLSRPFRIEDEDVTAQLTIEASLKTKVVSGDALSPDLHDINAQISDILLRSRKGLRIVLHTFSRCPKALVDAFEKASELQACKNTMKEQGLSSQVNSEGILGPFVFVCAEHYHALEEALRLKGSAFSNFRCWHVFGEERLSDVILEAAKKLPKKEKVYARKVSIVPLSFAAQMVVEQLEASILKTFIDIKLPSQDTGAQTVSTTSADPRKKAVAHRPCPGQKR